MSSTVPRQRVAVVGSGIAGLTNAFLLSSKYDVVVYEAAGNLGMDQNGVTLDSRFASGEFTANRDERHPSIRGVVPTTISDKSVRVDVPLRVFTESYYPHLTGLYDTVGVTYQPEDYASSFTSVSGETLFSYNNFLLGPLSIPIPSFKCSSKGLHITDGNGKAVSFFSTAYWQILRDVVSFLYKAPQHLRDGTLTRDSNLTLLQYLKQQHFSDAYIYRMALPSFAAIATCSLHSAAQYPAWVVVHYLVTRSWRGVRRARGGAEDVVHKLVKDCKEVKLNTRVTAVETIALPKADGKAKETRTVVYDSNGGREEFHAVVFATQANQTLRILQTPIPLSTSTSTSTSTSASVGADAPVAIAGVPADASDSTQSREVVRSDARVELEAALDEIKYESSRLVLHTDPALMPKHREDWRSVNFILPDCLEDMEKSANSNPFDACALDQVDIKASSSHMAQTRSFSGWLSEHDQRCIESIEKEGMATIWMNRVQHGLRDDIDIFQTWNPICLPSHEHLISISNFERPVVTGKSLRALNDVWKHQGAGGIYIVGSFSLPSVPLLESAASSAVKVAHLLGCDCPWYEKIKLEEEKAMGKIPPPKSPLLRQVLLAVADFVLGCIAGPRQRGLVPNAKVQKNTIAFAVFFIVLIVAVIAALFR